MDQLRCLTHSINIATSSIELATDLMMELEKEGARKKNYYSTQLLYEERTLVFKGISPAS